MITIAFAFFNNVPEFGEDGRVTNAAPTIAAPTRDQQIGSSNSKLVSQADGKEDESGKGVALAAIERSRSLADRSERPTPNDAVLQIPCESPNEFEKAAEKAPSFVPGVAGQACVFSETDAKPSIAGQKVPVSKRKPLAFSAWLSPAEGDEDVALLSSADYAMTAAATGFGKGVELRLVRGELEFRFADRFPAYSIRVRSKGAAIQPGQWRHVALVYRGAADDRAQRAGLHESECSSMAVRLKRAFSTKASDYLMRNPTNPCPPCFESAGTRLSRVNVTVDALTK